MLHTFSFIYHIKHRYPITWRHLLAFLVATFTLPAAFAQVPAPTSPGTGTVAPLAVVNPPADPNLVSVGSTGLNLICAGDHLTLKATGGNGSYTWSPNVGLSATVGATVVAGPLVTTLYTVTSTNPSTGAPTTTTINVNVRENCCPTSHNVGYIVEVPVPPSGITTFDTSTGSPFDNPATGQSYAVGTRFHFSGSSPIILRDLAFQPPMGSVILMDDGRDMYLENGASLSLAGVSITAACDQMWGRLWVRNTAAGIESTYANGTPGDPNNPPAANLPTLRNQVSHSLGGIDFEQATGSNYGPYYQLAGTDFLHNEQSMVMHRVNTPSSFRTSGDFVVGSLFDSQPDYFKSPKAYAVGDPNYPHYSLYHVWFTGNCGTEWDYSTFRNALFGFHSPNDGSASNLDAGGNHYENLWLAAFNLNSSNTSGQFAVGGPSYFVFPNATSLPSTPQFTNAIANDVLDGVGETRGIYTNGTLLYTVYNAYFRQTNNPYTDFTFSQRNRQVGMKVRRLGMASNNTFTLLHTGIQFSDVLFPAANPYNPLGTVNTSVFTQCQKGIEVSGYGTNRSSGGSFPPCLPTVYLPLECNTFDRGGSSFPGTAYGISMDYSSGVSLDPLPTTPPTPIQPHSNKFLDYLVGTPGYYAIYNGSCTIKQLFNYTTFPEYIAQSPSPRLFINHSQLSDLVNTTVTLLGAGTYHPGQTCGTGSPGLERNSGSTGLSQNNPNPATELTTFSYQLSEKVTTAELLISKGTDGRQLRRYSLPLIKSGTYELKLTGWQPGIYFVTLYANNVPVQTRRLLVQ